MERDNGHFRLSRQECLALLRTSHLGRVAVSVDALPVIVPVEYGVVDDRVVFRTAAGTKLAAALKNAVVAFEIDTVDPLYHRGWSVLVTGRCVEVTDPDELARCASLPLGSWMDGTPDRFVAIDTDVVTGRVLENGRQLVTAG